MLDLYQEAMALFAALEEEGVAYALCGALALAVPGAPRATSDIDLLTETSSVPRIIAIAKRLGFVFGAAPMGSRDGITVHRWSKIVEGEVLTSDRRRRPRRMERRRLDVVVSVAPTPASAEPSGPSSRGPAAPAAALRGRDLPFPIDPRHPRARSGLRTVWQGRIRASIGAHDLSVVSREGLIQMKLWAARPQDIADVERLREADR